MKYLICILSALFFITLYSKDFLLKVKERHVINVVTKLSEVVSLFHFDKKVVLKQICKICYPLVSLKLL